VHNTRVRGHLRDNVDRDPRACFEIDEPGEIFPYGRTECDTSIAYRSVVAFGRIRIVEDRAQKQRFFEG
jgi:nitroimidazol reductase NimA-like FMN-containing flavoprotein (pyridoxamine 5'-phosphate oxidase superfamily)